MVPAAQREQNLQPWKSWARKNLQQSNALMMLLKREVVVAVAI